MACCLFLLRLLAPLAARLGLDTQRSTPPRFPIVPVALVGLVELAAAWFIVNSRGTAQEAARSSGAGHDHSMADHSVDAISQGSGALRVLGGLVAVGVILAIGCWAARRLTSPMTLLGAGLALGSGYLALRPVTASTHVLLMAVVELTLIVVPLAVVGTSRHQGPTDDVWVVARVLLTAVTGAAAAFLLITLHLPSTHDWYLGSEGLAGWLSPLLLATGLAFWASVLRFRVPDVWRSLLLVLVLETGAVIGLVLLMSGQPVMDMEPGLGLGVLADQRLAGALMMAVDLLVLAWVVGPQLSGSRRTSTRPSSRISLAT